MDKLILAQKLVWFSQNFDIPHHTNQAAARHGALGFPSQPFKIMHWMYQKTWHVFEAVIWSLWSLDILILAQKLVWHGKIFDIPHTIQTMLLQDMEPLDSLPNHSKSCIGCIK
jgi:hypothetical protein